MRPCQLYVCFILWLATQSVADLYLHAGGYLGLYPTFLAGQAEAPFQFTDYVMDESYNYSIGAGNRANTPDDYYSSVLGPFVFPLVVEAIWDPVSIPIVVGTLGTGFQYSQGDVTWGVRRTRYGTDHYEVTEEDGQIDGEMKLAQFWISLGLGFAMNEAFGEIHQAGKPKREEHYVLFIMDYMIANLDYHKTSNTSHLSKIANWNTTYSYWRLRGEDRVLIAGKYWLAFGFIANWGGEDLYDGDLKTDDLFPMDVEPHSLQTVRVGDPSIAATIGFGFHFNLGLF